MISPILLFDFYLSLSPVVYSSEDRHLAKYRIVEILREKMPTDRKTL